MDSVLAKRFDMQNEETLHISQRSPRITLAVNNQRDRN